MILDSNKAKQNTTVCFVYESLCGLVLLCCYFFNSYWITDYISIVVLSYYLVKLFLNRNRLFWKYIYIAFMAVSCAISIILCEHSGLLLWELGVTSERTGAAPPLLFYYWLQYQMIIIFDRKFSQDLINSVKYEWEFDRIAINQCIGKYGLTIIFMLNVFLLLLVIKDPFFIYNVDRINYQKQYMPELAIRLYMYPIFLSPVAVIAVNNKDKYSNNQKLKSLLITYLPYIIFAFWTGNKFGLLWMLFYSVTIPGCDLIQFSKEKVLKNLSKVMAIVAVFFVIVMGYYVIIEGGIQNALVMFEQRTAMQSQLWWKMYSTYCNQGWHLNEFGDNINAIIESIKTQGNIREYGVYRLMEMLAPSEIVQGYLNNGVRFSAQGIELSYLYFSDAALFVMPIIRAFFFVWITNLLFIRTNTNCFIESIICCRLLIMVIAGFTQGDYFQMFTVEWLVSLVFLVCMSICVHHNNTNFISKKGEELRYSQS